MRRRIGRPGLVGTMARTAVVAGTATAVSQGVSGAMSGKQQQAHASQQQAAYEQGQRDLMAQQQAAAREAADTQARIDAAVADATARLQPAPAAAPAMSDDERFAKLAKLGELKTAGVLTEAEFAAEKARILGM